MKSTIHNNTIQELTMCHCRNFAFLFVIYNDFQLSLDSYIIMYLIVFMVAWCFVLHFLCWKIERWENTKTKTLISMEYPQMDMEKGIFLLYHNMLCAECIQRYKILCVNILFLLYVVACYNVLC